MGSNSQNAGTGTLSKAYYEMLARGVLRNVGPDPREICKKEGKRKCCSEEIKYQKLVRDHFNRDHWPRARAHQVEPTAVYSEKGVRWAQKM